MRIPESSDCGRGCRCVCEQEAAGEGGEKEEEDEEEDEDEDEDDGGERGGRRREVELLSVIVNLECTVLSR